MDYKDMKKTLKGLGLKIRKVPWGYLITRISDGGEYANFDSLDQAELYLYRLHGEI